MSNIQNSKGRGRPKKVKDPPSEDEKISKKDKVKLLVNNSTDVIKDNALRVVVTSKTKLSSIPNKINAIRQWQPHTPPEKMEKDDLVKLVLQQRLRLEYLSSLDMHRRIAGGNHILLTNYTAGDIVPFRVLDEHSGFWKAPYGQKEIQMRTDPMQVTFDASKYLTPKSRKGKIRRKLFGWVALKIAGIKDYGKFVLNLWLAEVTGEFTFPVKDQTPEDAKQDAERQNYMSAKAKEAEIIANMSAQFRRKEFQTMVIAAFIAIVGTVLIMSYFFSGQ